MVSVSKESGGLAPTQHLNKSGVCALFVDVSVPPPKMWTDLGTLLIFHVCFLRISFLGGQYSAFYVSLYVCIFMVEAFLV